MHDYVDVDAFTLRHSVLVWVGSDFHLYRWIWNGRSCYILLLHFTCHFSVYYVVLSHAYVNFVLNVFRVPCRMARRRGVFCYVWVPKGLDLPSTFAFLFRFLPSSLFFHNLGRFWGQERIISFYWEMFQKFRFALNCRMWRLPYAFSKTYVWNVSSFSNPPLLLVYVGRWVPRHI